MDIQTAAAWAAVLGGAGTFCSFLMYLILRPVNISVQGIEKAMIGLAQDLKEAGERQHSMEVRLAEVDSSVRSAHHRLNDHLSKEG